MILLQKISLILLPAALLIAAGFYPVNESAPNEKDVMQSKVETTSGMDAYADSPPNREINLVFIHHSVGGQLLADLGAEAGEGNNIFSTHPNGGGLRSRLQAQHYRVHEASFSSILGEQTDLFDWLPKFKTQMPRILTTEHQDRLLPEGHNEVVMFKSCFPNSFFRRDSGSVGNPAGPTLTLANAKAALTQVRELLAAHPNVLFVYVTAPPLRAHDTSERLWKYLAKKILGRPTDDIEQVEAATDAREFNNWVKSPGGWLKDYPKKNIVVFDYFDILTGDGRSNFLQFPSNNGKDDHPSTTGQQLTASRFVPFLNRAVRYAGIAD